MAGCKYKAIIKINLGFCSALLLAQHAAAEPVPGYVPPVTYDTAPVYADDTRGVYVPEHQQHRLMNNSELQAYGRSHFSDTQARQLNMASANQPAKDYRSPQNLGRPYDYASELERIASDPGALEDPQPQYTAQAQQPQPAQQQPQPATPYNPGAYAPTPPPPTAMQPVPFGNAASPYAPQVPQAMQAQSAQAVNGMEIAVGQAVAKPLDIHNSMVRMREERITVRRALQRMMDQIGAGDWTIVWDLAESNSALPEMEISVFAEEPFVNVLNALLARMQTRSSESLRVIRYDKTQRLVITDRSSGSPRTAEGSVPIGADNGNVAVTENVLKEARVSVHYDEVPLVDALESMVHQAGKGQWRLRMYAGTDETLAPAHIEEPFGMAMERVSKLFNLKYEVFPGGKLIVVTHHNRFGYQGVER